LPDAFGQAGHADAVRAEAVIEVVAEFAFAAEDVDGAVGCGDDTAAETKPVVAADGAKGAFFEDFEELDLGGDTDLADLIEEDLAERAAEA
jgi:hypothetical protein